MKWIFIMLGTVAALVMIAVGALFALGFRRDAGKVASSVVIDRPPAAVWPWITKPDRQKQWISWLIEIRPLTESTEGVGSRALWVMEDKNNNGQKMEITGEIVSVEPGQSVGVKLWSDGMFDGIASYNLVDLGKGETRMESKGAYHYQQGFARLMEPLITPQAKKKMDSDLAKLKSLVEAQGE